MADDPVLTTSDGRRPRPHHVQARADSRRPPPCIPANTLPQTDNRRDLPSATESSMCSSQDRFKPPVDYGCTPKSVRNYEEGQPKKVQFQIFGTVLQTNNRKRVADWENVSCEALAMRDD